MIRDFILKLPGVIMKYHLQVQETALVSTVARNSQTGLLTRWSVGERGRPSLVLFLPCKVE